ncbi:glycosyl transferase family 90-domain-containing protein [Mycena capillaripes]|nr:glycosyl transferase family 90-domain-containing protein [Mycena capillaripes]
MTYLRIFQKYTKPRRVIQSEDTEEECALPLLPFHPAENEDPLPRGLECPASTSAHPRGVVQGLARRCKICLRLCTLPYVVAGAAILGIVVFTVFLTVVLILSFTGAHLSSNSTPPTSAGDPYMLGHPMCDPSVIARAEVDAFLARQSTTLERAAGRYALRTGRKPPPYYADWYHFARERRCLIDEYDQIHRDFKPFYHLAKINGTFFRDMVERGRRALEVKNAEIATMVVKDGRVSMTGKTWYQGDYPETLQKFSRWLPDMTYLWNGKDGPRVIFDYRAPGALEKAFAVHDSDPFQHSYRPTGEFFARQSGCNVPMEATGFLSSANNFSGFLIETHKPGYTTDLYPMLSMSKISPCFSDILYPSHPSPSSTIRTTGLLAVSVSRITFHGTRKNWRGTASGGLIVDDNYLSFARFRLMHLGRHHPDLMDVQISTFDPIYCPKPCDRNALMKEYNITGKPDPREDSYGFKYVLDVDGAAFSGRFLGLLRSGSLVFKSTIFNEFFNDWLRPFEHYVPVLPDLSDLVEKVEWANANPEDARLIQQKGLEMVRRVLTDDQNDCYLYAAVVEWAQLLDYAKGSST